MRIDKLEVQGAHIGYISIGQHDPVEFCQEIKRLHPETPKVHPEMVFNMPVECFDAQGNALDGEVATVLDFSD